MNFKGAPIHRKPFVRGTLYVRPISKKGRVRHQQHINTIRKSTDKKGSTKMKNVKNTTKAQMAAIIDTLTKENQDLKTVIKNQRPISYTRPALTTADYVNFEKGYYKTNRAHTQAEADRYVKQIPVPQDTLNEKIDKAEAKEIKETKLPTPKQLRSFVALITHNNFGKDFKLQMPEEFTLATFQKLIAQLNAAHKAPRPGKPTKPSKPADYDSYYADCQAYYERRKKAICKLIVLYKEHADFIRATFK